MNFRSGLSGAASPTTSPLSSINAAHLRWLIRFSILALLIASAQICAAAVQMAASSSSALDRTRAALIVGNADYIHAAALRNPGNDAQDLCRSLREMGYETFCYTNITTRVQFRAVVEDFAEKLSPNSVSLFYYAGHAVQMSGENYLIPTAAGLQTQAAVVDQSISLGYVMRQLQSSRAFLKVVVIDACRDELSPGSSLSQLPDSAQINITSFPDDSFVLYSTGSDRAASDGQGRNGTLTKNLLAHIRDTGDLNDLFNSVADGVRADTAALGHPQTPEIRRNSTLRYCFVKCTDLEELRTREEQAAKEIADLQSSVAAGDRDAKAQLDAALKYQTQLKKNDEQLAKQARDREKKSFVPPSF